MPRRRHRPSRDAEPRSFARFRREVFALLVARGVPKREALRMTAKWNRYVHKRWKDGRPPCAVSDHLVKFEREGLVRPAVKRDARGRHYVARRDADNPRVGEIFESKNGSRWEVVSVTDKRVAVKRAGHRGGDATLQWGRSVLKTMRGKPVKREEAREEAAREVPREEPTIVQRLFGGGEGLVAPDPEGRRRGKSKRGKKAGLKVSRKLARKRQNGHPFKRCKKPTHVQSLVFSKKRFTLAQARAWARAHGYKSTKVDVTEANYRLRQMSPTNMKVVGAKSFKPGLSAVMACYK